MVSTRYPLATLLGQREQAVEEARLAVAGLEDRCEGLREWVADIRAELERELLRATSEQHAHEQEAASHGVPVATFHLWAERQQWLRAEAQRREGELAQAQMQWEQAQADLEQERERLRQHLADLEALRQHRGNWDQARRRAEEERELDESDPLVAALRPKKP